MTPRKNKSVREAPRKRARLAVTVVPVARASLGKSDPPYLAAARSGSMVSMAQLYRRQILAPFSVASVMRYPDATMVKTAITSLRTRRDYDVRSILETSASLGPAFLGAMLWMNSWPQLPNYTAASTPYADGGTAGLARSDDALLRYLRDTGASERVMALAANTRAAVLSSTASTSTASASAGAGASAPPVLSFPDITSVGAYDIRATFGAQNAGNGFAPAGFDCYDGRAVYTGTTTAQNWAPPAAGPQATYEQFMAKSRVLACGMRISITGLPSGVFMAPGTVYFTQIPHDGILEEVGVAPPVQFPLPLPPVASPTGSQDWWERQVLAGRAFRITMEEVRTNGGYTHFWLPSGPECFLYRDTGANLGMFQSGTSTFVSGGFDIRSTMSSSGPARPDLLLCGIFPGTGPLPYGYTIAVEFVHHVESVPDDRAAGIVPTSLAPALTDVTGKIQEGISHAATVEAATGGRSDLHLGSSTRLLSALDATDRSWAGTIVERLRGAASGAVAGYTLSKSAWGGAAGAVAGLLMPASVTAAVAGFGKPPTTVRAPAGLLL